MKTELIGVLMMFVAAAASMAQAPVPPASATPLKGLAYDAEFFPGAEHDPNVPTPDSVLGFRVGDKPATHAQIEAVVRAIAEKSPRARLFEYAKSHEGRTLYYLAIGSEANIRRLDEIKGQAARLADPRGLAAAEGDRIAETMPAIAWMAYCIHGDEMSGSDAALALAHHLAAGRGKDVSDLLDDVLVLIDPLMNPDGRDRCITGVAQSRTVQPSVDDQTMLHAQPWPTGRTNHYLFDLNRDWIFCTQPETRGRVKAVGEWNPHYFMESHEQGALDTFLFMPPRAPVNPNMPVHVREWEAKFAADQGKAFDARGWRYYTGEWNEGWYPGYSGSWAAMRGIVDNLYEQANINADAVRRPEGTLESYRESVHKQLVSSMANLETLARNREAVIDAIRESKRRAVENAGGEQRLFVLNPPTGNDARLVRLADLLELQGIEVRRAAADFTASGKDWLGRAMKDARFPAGTIFVAERQPLRELAVTLLETDPRMSPEFLTEERRELLRFGQSRLYDITGWNVAMLFGVEVSEVTGAPPEGSERVTTAALNPPPAGALAPTSVAWMLPGEDDRSVAAAGRLMEAGVKVRVLDKPSVLDGTAVARGSVFIMRKDNQDFTGDLAGTVQGAVQPFGVEARAIGSGMGPGDAPDLGGGHFVLQETPRVAVLGREPFSPYSFGEVWHLLDHEMGLRCTYLDMAQVKGVDLRRYNVLVIPSGGDDGWTDLLPDIKAWVEAGGTLIAIGSAAEPICKEKDGIGSTRLLPDVLTKMAGYRAAIVRDWLGKTVEVKAEEVWSHTAPAELEFPWTLGDVEEPSEEEAKRRDEWRSLFMPQGALLAARVDDRHWLTAGCGAVLPVLVGSGPVLIPEFGGRAPVLLGVFAPAPPAVNVEAEKKKADAAAKDEKGETKDEKDEPPPPGWLVAPPGLELRLRMSGLLWPEAADRLAHSAYVIQESVGAGQVILFNESPVFRAATRGATRVFMNAVVCGPGMGASAPINP